MRFLTDENFDGNILDGLRGRPELIDVIRVQDVGLREADDLTILEWAAQQGRIVLTQDEKTMPGFAYDRVRKGLRMPGVICVPQWVGIGRAVADLAVMAVCGTDEDFEGQVRYVPL